MHSILFYYLFYIRNEEYEEEYSLEDSQGDDGGQGHGVTRSYPIHDWSPPTTDLSPIEDVPSNMELEAEAEWLAYQSNGEYECLHWLYFSKYFCIWSIWSVDK